MSLQGPKAVVRHLAASACLTTALALNSIAWADTKPDDIVEVPMAQIATDLAAGKTTSVAVTNAYIARIHALDAAYKAVILIAPDALEQAMASDRRRVEGKALGPLDGIPILLKDNIEVHGMPATAGSYALAQNLPARDSEVARRLRAAGAVLLGKANLDQWAGMRTCDTFNGSTVGGGPHNPYDLTRSTSGSSSGPGIAAALSFAAATVGTETSGSVVSPASFMGLVGMKPSIALVSRRGIVPISLTQDTAGPLARSVTDAAMLLTVMAGSDAADPWSLEADAHKADYARGLNAAALHGARLGVLRGLTGYNDQSAAVFDRALAVLRAQGAELVEVPSALFEDLSQEQRSILLYDFKEDINHYLASTPKSVKTRTLTELIAFDRADPRENMHANDIFELAEQTQGGRHNPEYLKTLEYAKRRAGPEGIDRAVHEYHLSALVVLTGEVAGTIPPDGQPIPHYPLAKFPKGEIPPDMTTYAAVAGYPHLTVPMGLLNGSPLGLSFVGPKWSEQQLLSLGYGYEQASRARRPPVRRLTP